MFPYRFCFLFMVALTLISSIQQVSAENCISRLFKKVLKSDVKTMAKGPPLIPKKVLEIPAGSSSLEKEWKELLKKEDSATVFSVMKRRYQIVAKVLAPLGENVKTTMSKTNKAQILKVSRKYKRSAASQQLIIPPIYDIGRAINENYKYGELGGRGVYEVVPDVLKYLFGEIDEIPQNILRDAPESIPVIEANRNRFLHLKDGLSPKDLKRVESKYLHILYNGLKTDKEFDAIGIFDPKARLIWEDSYTTDNKVLDYVIPTGAYGEEFTKDLILAGQTFGKIVDDGRGSVFKRAARGNQDMLVAEMARARFAESRSETAQAIREATQEGILSIVQSAALLTKHKIPGVDNPKEALKILLETRPDGTSLLTEFTSKHMMGLVGPFNLSGRHFGPAIVKHPDGHYVFSNEFKTNLSQINRKILDKIKTKMEEAAKREKEMREIILKDNPKHVFPQGDPKRPQAESHLGKCPMTKKCDDNGRQPLQGFVEGYLRVYETISQ